MVVLLLITFVIIQNESTVTVNSFTYVGLLDVTTYKATCHLLSECIPVIIFR